MAETRTGEEECIAIDAEAGIVVARVRGRAMAQSMGFSGLKCTQLATAISELARNIVTYAGQGRVVLRQRVREDGVRGIEVVAEDEGPGIADLELALRDGFSTSRSLGLGLPGTRRLMDEFDVRSELGGGVVVRTVKWCRSSRR